MDRHEVKPVVLARIPNLNSSGTLIFSEGPLASSGRIINQAFSFRVLASVTLLLVAVAIVPLTFKRDAPPPEPTATAEVLSPAAPAAPAAPAPPAPPAVSTAAAPAQPAPAVATPASPSPTQSVAATPSVASVTPASASIDEPLMSTWPNPSQPTCPQADAGAGESRADVNQSMALRPPEQIRK
jgi:hypothetical protein